MERREKSLQAIRRRVSAMLGEATDSVDLELLGGDARIRSQLRWEHMRRLEGRQRARKALPPPPPIFCRGCGKDVRGEAHIDAGQDGVWCIGCRRL